MPRRFLPEPHGLRRCCARRGWSGSGPGTVPVLAAELAEFDACGTQSLCRVPAIGSMTCLPGPCEIRSVDLRHLARRCALPQGREALLLPVIIGRADDCRPRDGGHFELLCSCSRRRAKESNGKTQERHLAGKPWADTSQGFLLTATKSPARRRGLSWPRYQGQSYE